ncbi:phospholipase [Aquabacterium sp. OR-4]|nr:phospholipase [Aquabacterium sp. OR-4]MDT7835278.1 phospholipase [Aquabacterium sp. OR-4]
MSVSPGPRALRVFAGPRALQHLRAQGLRPHDVRVIPAAAGGPKGLILGPLDRWLFGHWLAGSTHTLHLLGASIGAWRMAAAAQPDADAALAQLSEDYIGQTYEHAPGQLPSAAVVSRVFGANLAARFAAGGPGPLEHPTRRLHVFTSRGKGLLHREGRWCTPAGYLAAYAANLVSRRAMGRWLERVVFADPRDALPFALHDYPAHQVALRPDNLATAIQASCSIPFWLEAVQDVPGGPPGAYWDGGITDYHLHLDYASMAEGLVLYPHFQRTLVPGWLDKSLRHRHRASPWLDNVIVLAPDPAWIARLPGGKLPDRGDFKRFASDEPERMRRWRQAVAAAQQLADEAALWAADPARDALPL